MLVCEFSFLEGDEVGMDIAAIKQRYSVRSDVFSDPILEKYEPETLEYLKSMKKYIDDLRKMPEEDAQKIAKENLVKSGIMQENGEFTEEFSCLSLIFKGEDTSKTLNEQS